MEFEWIVEMVLSATLNKHTQIQILNIKIRGNIYYSTLSKNIPS